MPSFDQETSTSSTMSLISAEEHILKQLTKDMDSTKLRIFFDIDSTVSWISNHGYRRVALQFPDYFLSLSADIATLLERECNDNAKTYILADTTYRSCCVDLIAAEQCGADCIIHYGDSCMSETVNRIPTRFVFGNVSIDWRKLEEAVHEYKDQFEPNCCLLFDAIYANSSDTLFDVLSKFSGMESLFNCKLLDQSSNSKHSQPSTSSVDCCLGRVSPREKQNMTLLFIGETGSPLLPLWLMTNLSCINVFTFSPITLKYSFERTPATRLLKKRLFLIEKLRDAQTVGIVINTLDLVGYKEAVERARKLCKVAGKKSYTLAVGKINVPKLSNFANDIEAFIVLSCPYGIILDVSDFYRPVLSLFEAEAALNPQCRWSAGDGWAAEFKNFLHDEIGSETEMKSDLSLITGRMRITGVEDNDSNGINSCNALTTYAAGDYFSQRTWKGLDDGYTSESVSVREGRSGVASKYNSEPFV
ncbi:diphthamide biosynthesis protein 2 [Loa loa]|uniref:2-(3-amino-3-carboxypropyl)histidine synthase subunit 2 n=2 Tax=Loa loa TaxID=7209 RepID=A0A1I7V6W2_LOALO|nr:diphthamide biosynthesis protein 2 [Loa loa]EFO23169.2 diphthamide biosynthesis protein 2 [Loa loa]